MKKGVYFFQVSIFLVLLISGCAPAKIPDPTLPIPTSAAPTITVNVEPVSDPIVVTDDLGVEITLEEPARAIISISPSLTEILFSVGAGDRLIGRDSNSQFPQEALTAVDLGGMWDGIPVEDILAMEPDLILAGEIYSVEAVDELRALGLVVYWQKDPADFEGLFENIRAVSVLTGTEDQAEMVIESLQSRIADLDDQLLGVEGIPLVFYELDASDPSNPWTPGEDTFISYIINRAKGQNLGDSLIGEWVQISSEELLAQNPDYILLADALYGITPESVAGRSGWNEIKAVVENDIYPFDPFVLSVPGPRLVEGYEQVAAILHPDILNK